LHLAAFRSASVPFLVILPHVVPVPTPCHARVRSQHTFNYAALSLKQQSFCLDLKLIGLSCWISFRGRWEHRGRKF
jgi:hypothetical protein